MAYQYKPDSSNENDEELKNDLMGILNGILAENSDSIQEKGSFLLRKLLEANAKVLIHENPKMCDHNAKANLIADLIWSCTPRVGESTAIAAAACVSVALRTVEYVKLEAAPTLDDAIDIAFASMDEEFARMKIAMVKGLKAGNGEVLQKIRLDKAADKE